MASREGYVMTEDGVRLFFQKIGNGPNVVVIPNAEYMFDDFKYARLVTIENAAHLPWIESPEKVSRSIQIFLDGGWPNS